MNEAPARLWIDPEYIEDENDCVSRVKIMHRDVEYIRADLVDELVGALEEVLAAERFSNRPPETTMQAEEKLERIKQAVLKAEAALKALEEA